MVRCDKAFPRFSQRSMWFLSSVQGSTQSNMLTKLCTDELSEEDEQLKSELEMLVERLKVPSLSCPMRIAQ